MASAQHYFSLLKESMERLSGRQNVSIGDFLEELASIPSGAFLEGHRERAADYMVAGPLARVEGRLAELARLHVALRERRRRTGRPPGFITSKALLNELKRINVYFEAFSVGEMLVVIAALGGLSIMIGNNFNFMREPDPFAAARKAGAILLLSESINRMLRMMERDGLVTCGLPCDVVIPYLSLYMREAASLVTQSGELGDNYRPRDVEVAGIVFGVDYDSDRIYAHLLPPTLAYALAALRWIGGLDEAAVRDLMGFDLQPWEIRGRPEAGKRIRIQGDIVVEVIEYCDGGDCAALRLLSLLKTLERGDDAFAAKLQRAMLSVEPPSCEGDLGGSLEEFVARVAQALTPPGDAGYLRSIARMLLLRGVLELYDAKFYVALRGGCSGISSIRVGEENLYLHVDVRALRGDGSSVSHLAIAPLRVKASEALENLVLSKAFEERVGLYPFRAVVNETHVVEGYGAALAAPMPSAYLKIPRPLRVLTSIDGDPALGFFLFLLTPSRQAKRRHLAGVLRDLARIAAYTAYYYKQGDLYVYTHTGKLLFSHEEHGDTMLDLGGPAVVRITSLNTAPPQLLDDARDPLEARWDPDLPPREHLDNPGLFFESF